MKKTLLIILSLTVYSLALDCINLATFGTINTLPNARPDSSFNATIRRYIYANGDTIDEPYYYSSKTFWNGNSIEKKVQYEGSSLDSLKIKSTVIPSITIQKDGDEIFTKSKTESFESEEITYISKDSSYSSSSLKGYKNGSYYTSSDTERRYIRNDTLFISTNFTESGGNSFSGGHNNYFIVHDPENKDQCIEKMYYINDDETISVKDKILDIFTIEKTDNGFVVIRKSSDNSSTDKIFYINKDIENTTSIKRKIRPTFDYKKVKHFDLLGRPAQGKYTVEFLK